MSFEANKTNVDKETKMFNNVISFNSLSYEIYEILIFLFVCNCKMLHTTTLLNLYSEPFSKHWNAKQKKGRTKEKEIIEEN